MYTKDSNIWFGDIVRPLIIRKKPMSKKIINSRTSIPDIRYFDYIPSVVFIFVYSCSFCCLLYTIFMLLLFRSQSWGIRVHLLKYVFYIYREVYSQHNPSYLTCKVPQRKNIKYLNSGKFIVKIGFQYYSVYC